MELYSFLISSREFTVFRPLKPALALAAMAVEDNE